MNAKKKKSGSVDAAIVMVALFGLLLSGYFVQKYLFKSGIPRDGTHKLAGKMVNLENDVKLKPAESITWYPLSREEDVFIGDTVFTGEASTSNVKLVDGAKVLIAPSSLVTFSERNGQFQVTLHYGKLNSELNQREILVNVGNEVQTLSPNGATVEITKDKKRSAVRLLRGEAKIKKRDIELALRANELVDLQKVKPPPPVVPPVVAAKKPEPVPEPKVEMPPPAAPTAQNSIESFQMSQSEALTYDGKYFKINPRQDTTLTWQADSKNPQYEIETASTEDFSEIIEKQTLQENKLPFSKIGIDPLYWRVRVKEEGNEKWSEFSPTQKLTPKLPVFITSSQSFKIDEQNGKPAAIFTAKKVPAIPQYKFFEVNGDKMTETNIAKVSGDTLVVQGSPGKRIQVRAVGLNKAGQPITAYSRPFSADFPAPAPAIVPEPVPEPPREVAAVEVAPPPAPEPIQLPPPTLKSPSSQESFVSFGDTPLVIVFKWNGDQALTNHEIQVSQEEEFSNPLIKKSTGKPRYVFSGKLNKGAYFWRVRSKDSAAWTDWTEPKKFEVTNQ